MGKFDAVLKARKSAPAEQGVPEVSPSADKRGRRAPGKRSDPNYEQVTAYIRKDTYTAVKRHLFLEENGREFSDLVEHLLSEYVSTRKRK